MRLLEGLQLRQLVKVYIEYIVDVLRLFDVLGSIPSARQDEVFQSATTISSAYVMYM